ncbi:MAG TPA: condensation domain-containing protein [Pilimelia sp.]|nr:condensation domain-containing protein [Pilimelia sp.]
MHQIPLSDLHVRPGRLLEWTLCRPMQHAPDRAKLASYNQEKHFTAAVSAREENAPEKNWVASTFELTGPPDVAALEAALRLFVRRHEVLRCGFERLAGDLRCDVIPPAEIGFDRTDVGGFGTAEEVRAYLNRRITNTINTLDWPLFLAGAVLRPDGATVYLAFDHIVCDGMSLVIAVNELATAYEANRRGEPVVLPAVGSYLDFGDTQRDRYAGLRADGPELAYWRSFIASAGTFFPRIPLDFGVPDGAVHPATNETIPLLDDAEATAFEERCRTHGAKLFMGLLAAVGMALRDVAGVPVYRGLMPIGERKLEPWDRSFGWFVNTLPIEFPIPPDAGFDTVLAGARAGFRDLIRSVDTPFVKAWELLAPQYYGLRSWPYPVNFFSFLDYRRLPGAAQHDRWRPTTIPQATHSNTGNMWLFRNARGVYLNTIYPDTPQGRAAMSAYRGAIARTVAGVAADARIPAHAG